MSSRPIKIDIAGDELRRILLSREKSLSEVAGQLGVTRQALHGWLRSGKLPLPRLLDMSKAFTFSAEDIGLIKCQSDVSVQFRTHRRKEVPEGIKERVKQVAREFVLHSKPFAPIQKVINFRFQTEDPRLMAAEILRVLKLPGSPIILEQTLASTARLNLPVFFLPFDEDLRTLKVQGFAATCGGQDLIFLDSELALEDVAYNLFHELTHIFVGNSDGQSVVDEKFCNDVANEILTPTDFFRREDIRKSLKAALKNISSDLVQLVEEISYYLGASFTGVVIALKDNKILSNDHPAYKYLWGAVKKRKDHSIKVSDLITPNKESNVVEFWVRALQDPSRVHFLRFHNLILHGLLSDKISLARAAEVFDVDVMTMREISLAKDLGRAEAQVTH